MLTAVLFDMDGTLIDSEPVWVASIRACLADRGIAAPQDVFLLTLAGEDEILCIKKEVPK